MYKCPWCLVDVEHHEGCALSKGVILKATEFTSGKCENCHKPFFKGQDVVFESLNQLGALYCVPCSEDR